MSDQDLDLELAASNPAYRRRAIDQLNRESDKAAKGTGPVVERGSADGGPDQLSGDGDD